MNYEWKQNTGQYSSGEILFVGKWAIGGYHWDGMRSKDNPNAYKATCKLPGIKTDLGNFPTADEAKQKAEVAASHWFKNCNL